MRSGNVIAIIALTGAGHWNCHVRRLPNSVRVPHLFEGVEAEGWQVDSMR
jgi:hypothetical protein